MTTQTPTLDQHYLNLLAEYVADQLNNLSFFPADVAPDAVKRALPAFLAAIGVQATAPTAPARRTKSQLNGATADVPKAVREIAEQREAAYKAAHRGFCPPAPFDAGVDSERASTGLPGHCWVCAILGHVVAHPELGCGDVRCDSDHTGPGQRTQHTCTPEGKALPFGRKAPIGECLRCDQLRAGAPARQAHPAIQAAARRRDDEAQTETARTAHFAPGGPHVRGECGPVCTAFDY